MPGFAAATSPEDTACDELRLLLYANDLEQTRDVLWERALGISGLAWTTVYLCATSACGRAPRIAACQVVTACAPLRRSSPARDVDPGRQDRAAQPVVTHAGDMWHARVELDRPVAWLRRACHRLASTMRLQM